MGLSIIAYGGVRLVKQNEASIECLHEWADDNIDGDYVIPYINPHFPVQGVGIVDGVYSYTESYGDFHKSYSGYSSFRDALSKASGVRKMTVLDMSFNHPKILDKEEYYFRSSVENQPYSARIQYDDSEYRLKYLVNFSDCEGTINTTCCKIILEDLLEIGSNTYALMGYENNFAELKAIFTFAVVNEGFVVFS